MFDICTAVAVACMLRSLVCGLQFTQTQTCGAMAFCLPYSAHTHKRRMWMWHVACENLDLEPPGLEAGAANCELGVFTNNTLHL